MNYSVIISGFGGQGVLLIGDLLAYTAMKAGLHVTWMPSYGVEMRGGTARCTVVVSDEKIGSPIVEKPDAVIAMNMPSVEKFNSYLPTGGLLMVNSTIVGPLDPPRKDIEIVNVPTQEIAEAAGNKKMANVAILGAFIGKTEVLKVDFMDECIDTFVPPARKKLIPQFRETLHLGEQFIRDNRQKQAI